MQLCRLTHVEVIEKVCHIVYMKTVNIRGFFVCWFAFYLCFANKQGFSNKCKHWSTICVYEHALFIHVKKTTLAKCVKAQLGKERNRLGNMQITFTEGTRYFWENIC